MPWRVPAIIPMFTKGSPWEKGARQDELTCLLANFRFSFGTAQAANVPDSAGKVSTVSCL